MSVNDACPLPGEPAQAERAAIDRMLKARRIAVVGISDKPDRPSHDVGHYLQAHGYEIVPVNPAVKQVLGEHALASLKELPRPVDVVLVFRRSEFCAEITRDAIAVRAKGIWLQSGIRSDEAQRLAEKAGIDFVEDRCMMVMHMRSGPTH